MASDVTNRVILPNGKKVYVTDDNYGDDVIEQIYEQYGNCEIQACTKVFGNSLDTLKPFWTGTITNYFN